MGFDNISREPEFESVQPDENSTTTHLADMKGRAPQFELAYDEINPKRGILALKFTRIDCVRIVK
jgi:hypothetical protein